MALNLTIFLDDGGVMNDNALRAVTVFSAGEVSLRQACSSRRIAILLPTLCIWC